MIDVNPAKLGVDNPTPRRREQRPFESWAEVEAVAANLGPRYGSMVVFAAATGLRPAEWIALERRDVDSKARVVYVHRSFTKGRLKCTRREVVAHDERIDSATSMESDDWTDRRAAS